MDKKIVTKQHLQDFYEYLISTEKSTATIEKYLRDVRAFFVFLDEREVTKEIVILYKHQLQQQKYAIRSINSMLASINSFLCFMGWEEFKVKNIRLQRQIYCAEKKELTKNDYLELLKAAQFQPQLNLIIQTICGTGIRVSELKYFTVEAVRNGELNVHCKSKVRTIMIPGKLRKMLINYAKKNQIKEGVIFVNRKGKPLDRSYIWAKMKGLCEKANVEASKVFPHNLRKLFARTFYKMEKDVAKLADILGHGSIETTRIYIMSTGEEHRRKVEKLGLII